MFGAGHRLGAAAGALACWRGLGLVSNLTESRELLRSSAAYATAKLSFANAIVIAQRAGETDEEIAHVTGYTVPMIRAVLRSS